MTGGGALGRRALEAAYEALAGVEWGSHKHHGDAVDRITDAWAAVSAVRDRAGNKLPKTRRSRIIGSALFARLTDQPPHDVHPECQGGEWFSAYSVAEEFAREEEGEDE